MQNAEPKWNITKKWTLSIELEVFIFDDVAVGFVTDDVAEMAVFLSSCIKGSFDFGGYVGEFAFESVYVGGFGSMAFETRDCCPRHGINDGLSRRHIGTDLLVAV